MIRYAQNTDSWEDWQLDYRLGLILIMPPKEVSESNRSIAGAVRSEISCYVQYSHLRIGPT